MSSKLPSKLRLGMTWHQQSKGDKTVWLGKPSGEFWQRWRTEKAVMKDEGFNVTKVDGEWLVTFSAAILPEDEQPLVEQVTQNSKVVPYFDYDLNHLTELDVETIRRCALRGLSAAKLSGENDKDQLSRLLASVSSPRNVTHMVRIIARNQKLIRSTEEKVLIEAIVNTVNTQQHDFLRKYRPETGERN